MTEPATGMHAPARRAGRRALVAAGCAVALLALGMMLDNVWLDVVLLGIVEGITEWLPISSTGHLLVVSRLVRFPYSLGGTFEIAIQLGAVLAVLSYYARDLVAQARALPYDAPTRRFWLAICVAFVPTALAGLLLRDWIKRVLFESPTLIAWSLIVGGGVFVLVERLPLRVATSDLGAVTLRQALGVGVAQVLALIPGVSRSGAAIVGGLIGGLDRRTATAFSFYLAIPTLGGATLVDLAGSLHRLQPADIVRLALGTTVAMLTSWLALGWLLRYVAHHGLAVFGVYRIIAGLTILVLAAWGWV